MGMWMQGCTYVYTATALGKCRVASPTLGRLYSQYSYYSRLSGPQEQSGYEGVKKNLDPSGTRDVVPVAKHLAAWATWPLKKTMTWIQSPLSHLKEHIIIFIVTSQYKTMYIYCGNVCKTIMPATLFVYIGPKKKELPLWVRKTSSIFGLKAVTSPLAFGPVRFTTPLPPTLVCKNKR